MCYLTYKNVCFQFILSDQNRIMPKSFVNPDFYENFDKDYMFLGCIKYINSVSGNSCKHDICMLLNK